MAKEKYPYKAWRKLAEADAALTADDLTGLSEITASSAEINALDTATAGTAAASTAVIAGASAEVKGLRRAVNTKLTGTTALAAADAGSILTNNGAEATVTFTLPAALPGMEFLAYVLAAQELRLDPNGTETIGLPSSGVQQAGGKYLSADAVGEYLYIACVKAGQWETLNYRGTWTVEGAE